MKSSGVPSTIAGILALVLACAGWARAPAPVCDDLVWSAQVLAANPDIGKSCQGVYVRNDTLYAKVKIQLTKVRGERLTFRPQLRDGTLGQPRSIRVDSGWRATIDGKRYRAQDLSPGQVLSVYVPEDRFALTLGDSGPEREDALIRIEKALDE